MDSNEVIFLTPCFSHTIWGGNKLRTVFGYDESGDDIGECWGVSAHPSGDCTVRGGAYDGKKLSELWKEAPEIFGSFDSDRFPLLIKIIDARDDLSIQVHPDDEYAGVHENGSLGKTECWYILDCDEDATIVVGHNAKDKEELKDMIKSGRWNDFIRLLPIRKGDFIQIDPGTVHAIKGGTLLLETQQSSDITYRVYDYDRLQNGLPRQLHIDQSIDVIVTPAKSAEESVIHRTDDSKNRVIELYSCKYYTVSRMSVDGEAVIDISGAPFTIMSVTEGEGSVNGNNIKKGDHFILPHGTDEAKAAGNMELVFSRP